MTPSDYQTTEENFTPDNYEEVKDNPLYHHSKKGCCVEIRVSKYKNFKDKHQSWAYTKYCHTHGVLCSKTGWEMGYYQGTKSVTKERKQVNWHNCKDCGRRFIYSTDLQLGLCPYCFQKKATDEQGFDLVCWRREHANELEKKNKARREKELADKTHQRRLELDREFERREELKNLLQKELKNLLQK